MLRNVEVEICVNSQSEAYVRRAVCAAEQGGASRIELCAAMEEDGLTPAVEHIHAARQSFESDGLMVMVRPRSGHFFYSLEESDVMVRQIEMAAQAGADGVVFGGLRARDHGIDEGLLERLLDVTRGLNLKTTFHRAFDATVEPVRSLDILMQYGVDRVLTSGMPWGSDASALKGISLLRQLITQAGNAIEIVIGGGITPANSHSLLSQLPVTGRVSLHAYSGVLEEGNVSSKCVEMIGQKSFGEC
ncbi:copper homeostasis protein CutC [Endozoicomonas montiporae]|uniref:PF03932 family protein CutC n=1 Tax=Endozoicomonas montiporae CL-33 TaxID=570277 RepID=A0A142BFS3_9GAMM|nr:copper homeostasis protein CutC [Endozoicomonas montiporae]AMO57599.1 CutC protein [Endozoicomonas montiporae CL-33]